MQKAACFCIQQRGMGEVELQSLAVLAPGLAKEGDLKAEAMTVFGVEMAGDIPPLGAKVRMAAVIAWEGKDFSWLGQCKAICGGLCMQPWSEQEE
jgi:hypothetical protein